MSDSVILVKRTLESLGHDISSKRMELLYDNCLLNATKLDAGEVLGLLLSKKRDTENIMLQAFHQACESGSNRTLQLLIADLSPQLFLEKGYSEAFQSTIDGGHEEVLRSLIYSLGLSDFRVKLLNQALGYASEKAEHNLSGLFWKVEQTQTPL